MTNTNPLLGPLQYNGGSNSSLWTHALLPGSPATDARGYVRVGGCDRGAFEYVACLKLPLIER